MVCTGGNEWLTVTNEFDDENILEVLKTRRGKLTLELTKSYTGDDLDVTIECTIDADAIERNSIATGTPKEPVDVSSLNSYDVKVGLTIKGQGDLDSYYDIYVSDAPIEDIYDTNLDVYTTDENGEVTFGKFKFGETFYLDPFKGGETANGRIRFAEYGVRVDKIDDEYIVVFKDYDGEEFTDVSKGYFDTTNNTLVLQIETLYIPV